jgi:hypothetical protein
MEKAARAVVKGLASERILLQSKEKKRKKEKMNRRQGSKD